MRWIKPANVIKDTQKAVLEYCPRYQRFEWFGPYSMSHLPKLAGFYWSPEYRCWITPYRVRALKLIRFADHEAQQKLTA